MWFAENKYAVGRGNQSIHDQSDPDWTEVNKLPSAVVPW